MIRSERAIDRHNIPRYYAYAFLMDFALWSGIWIKYLIDDRGFELRWILAMDLPFWLVVAALQAPMGALADRVGRRRVLAGAALAFALVVLGFGLTTSYWMLFIDYVLWAIAMSMRGGVDSALLFDTLKNVGREHYFAKVAGRGFAVRLLAGVAGLVLGAFFAEQAGLARAVQVGALPPLLATLVALSLREPAIERTRQRYLASLIGGLAFAWRHAEVRYTLLIGSVLLAGAFGGSVLVQPFLLEHDVSTRMFGLFQVPLRLASVIAALLAFWISRRTATGRLFLGACGVIIAAYAGLAAWGATAAFTLFLLPALIAGLADPIVGAHLNVRIPSQQRATVLSVMALLFALQLAVFEPVLGFVADGASLRAAFLFSAAYFMVLMPPLMVLWARAHGRRAAPAGAEDLLAADVRESM